MVSFMPQRLIGLPGCAQVTPTRVYLLSSSSSIFGISVVLDELRWSFLSFRVCWCVQRQCSEHSVLSSEVGFEMLFCTIVARTAHLGILVSPGCVQSHCHTIQRLGHFGDVLNITGSGCNKAPGKKEVRYTLCSLETLLCHLSRHIPLNPDPQPVPVLPLPQKYSKEQKPCVRVCRRRSPTSRPSCDQQDGDSFL